MITRIVIYKKLKTYLSTSMAILEVTMGIIESVISKTLKETGIYINTQIKIVIVLSSTYRPINN